MKIDQTITTPAKLSTSLPGQERSIIVNINILLYACIYIQNTKHSSENVHQRGVLFFRGMLNFLGGCSFFRGKSVHLVIFYVTGYSQSHVLFSDMFKNIRGIRGCSLFQKRLIFQRHPSFFKLVSLFHHVSMIF